MHKLKSIKEIGMKITAAQREFRHYTDASAEAVRRGLGSSRPELVWTRRYPINDEKDCPAKKEAITIDQEDCSSSK